MAKLGTFVAGQVLTAAELNAMGGAWPSYTPTWTGITTGNGVNSGAAVQFGRTTVWRASFVFGTTSAVTGAITVSLPFSRATLAEVGLFSVRLVDSGTAEILGQLTATGAGTTFNVQVPNGVALSSTVPFTWTSTDAIHIVGCYEASS